MTLVILSVCCGSQRTLKWLKIKQQKRKEAMGFLEETQVSDHAVFLLVQSKWSWDWHCYAEQGPVGEGEGATWDWQTRQSPCVAMDRVKQSKW